MNRIRYHRKFKEQRIRSTAARTKHENTAIEI